MAPLLAVSENLPSLGISVDLILPLRIPARHVVVKSAVFFLFLIFRPRP